MRWLARRARQFGTRVRAALAERSTPGRVAAAIALGVLLGMSPLLGLQTVLGVVLASALKLNRVLTVLGTNVTFGPLLPAVVAGEIALGAKLLGRPLPDLSREHVLASARDATLSWWLGFGVLAPPLAALLAIAAWGYARRQRAAVTSPDASD